MKKNWTVTMGLMLWVLLGFSQVHAILIDNFNDTVAQLVNDPAGGGSTSDTRTLAAIQAASGDAIGDRTIEVLSNGPLNVAAGVDGLGSYSHSQDAGAEGTTGMSMVTWDNFGTVDLSDPSLFVLVTVDFADQAGGEISFKLTDDDGDMATSSAINVPLVIGSSQQFMLALAGFSHGAGFEFDTVSEIKMTVDGADVPALDLTIDIVEAQVPEPGSVLLLGSGMLGLWYWRRRKAARQNSPKA